MSEVKSDKERQIYDITYMKNLKKKKGINEPIYKVEIESHMWKIYGLFSPRGNGGWDKLGDWD